MISPVVPSPAVTALSFRCDHAATGGDGGDDDDDLVGWRCDYAEGDGGVEKRLSRKNDQNARSD